MKGLATVVVLLWTGTITVTALKCTDWQGRDVEEGTQFIPDKADPCKECLCHNGFSVACKSVMCSPPDCDRYEEVVGECCKFICIDDPQTGPDGNGTYIVPDLPGIDSEAANLGLRLVASTVTSLLILALLLFMVHRLRQRRLLIMMRRLHNERREEDTINYMSHLDNLDIGIEFPPYEDPPPPYSPPKPPDLPQGEAPPPYQEHPGDVSNNNNESTGLNGSVHYGDSDHLLSPGQTRSEEHHNGSVIGNGSAGYDCVSRHEGCSNGAVVRTSSRSGRNHQRSRSGGSGTRSAGTSTSDGQQQAANHSHSTPSTSSGRDSQKNTAERVKRSKTSSRGTSANQNSVTESARERAPNTHGQSAQQDDYGLSVSVSSVAATPIQNEEPSPNHSHVIVRMHNSTPRSSLYRETGQGSSENISHKSSPESTVEMKAKRDSGYCIDSKTKHQQSKTHPRTQFIKRSDSIEIKCESSSPRNSFYVDEDNVPAAVHGSLNGTNKSKQNSASSYDISNQLHRFPVDRMTQSCHESYRQSPDISHEPIASCSRDEPMCSVRRTPMELPLPSSTSFAEGAMGLSSTSSSSGTTPSMASPLLPQLRSGSITSQASHMSVCSETGESRARDTQAGAVGYAGITPFAISNDAHYPTISSNGPRVSARVEDGNGERGEEPMDISGASSVGSASHKSHSPEGARSVPTHRRLIYRDPDEILEDSPPTASRHSQKGVSSTLPKSLANSQDNSANSCEPGGESPGTSKDKKKKKNKQARRSQIGNGEGSPIVDKAADQEKREKIKRRESPETYRRLSQAWDSAAKYKQYGFIDTPSVVDGEQEVIDLPPDRFRSVSKERRRSKERSRQHGSSRESSWDRKRGESQIRSHSGERQRRRSASRERSNQNGSMPRERDHSGRRKKRRSRHSGNFENHGTPDRVQSNGVESHSKGCSHKSRSPSRRKKRRSTGEAGVSQGTQVDNGCLEGSASKTEGDNPETGAIWPQAQREVMDNQNLNSLVVDR